jgi:Putative Flp pilus-assembly TadE/G-like
MKRPAIARYGRQPARERRGERGVTMVLVAVAMVAIMAMAALSIDVVTLYLANAEAQRSADAAALAAARILSITGVTGDPANTPTGSGSNAWQSACQLATQVATAVAQQNTVAGATLPAAQVTVTYPNNSDTAACSAANPAFGVNPLVSVNVQRTNLPTFFARIWGHKGASVSATAEAEAFNPSASNVSGNNGDTGTLIPVQPRCVKPLLIPNSDPSPSRGGAPFIATDGSIPYPGIDVAGSTTGVIGETFSLTADCTESGGAAPRTCIGPALRNNPPIAGQYIPALVSGTPVAAMSCASDTFQSAIAGCDQSTVYACGVPGATTADLTTNGTTDTSTAAQCLINQYAGADQLDPNNYPYQIRAGTGNPFFLAGVVNSGDVVTNSNSIATLPVLAANTPTLPPGQPLVTVVGFLQVFINDIGGATGNDLQITVLNVAGCGDGTKTPIGAPVTGTSPVPVRLVQKYP